ncbi:MAG TPA: PH domain-containing protein [Acidimicrobiales bacterium]|nr:PH domain-containing protein [Acidimicrobiales bacterium]
MSRRDLWREDEIRVISVTPVSRGVLRPTLVTLTTIALIVEGASRYRDVHRFEDWLLLILVAPLAAVTLTRTWRWRSRKVHVTSDRVIVEGGVLGHQRSSIELRDVLATRVDQRVSERLTRRGFLVLETLAGPVVIGQVRHPSALSRLIDAQRRDQVLRSVPLDTVFSVEGQNYYPGEVRPDEWQRHRYE